MFNVTSKQANVRKRSNEELYVPESIKRVSTPERSLALAQVFEKVSVGMMDVENLETPEQIECRFITRVQQIFQENPKGLYTPMTMETIYCEVESAAQLIFAHLKAGSELNISEQEIRQQLQERATMIGLSFQ
jgi:hypothetical protein